MFNFTLIIFTLKNPKTEKKHEIIFICDFLFYVVPTLFTSGFSSFVDEDRIMGAIMTELPDQLALSTGGSIEIFKEELREMIKLEND